jgi:hypothetical protein
VGIGFLAAGWLAWQAVQGTLEPVKSKDTTISGIRGFPASVTLPAAQTRKVVESPSLKADFAFNAIAPHWKEKGVGEANRLIEVRVSNDGENWTEWMDIEAVGPTRDDDPHPDRTFAETPILVDGRFFQTRVTLARDTASAASPEVSDLKINYIDSRQSQIQKLAAAISNALGGKAYAAAQGPRIVSRAEWGSPDPYGKKYRGTDKYWQPSYKATGQIFLHHTVTPNRQSDPAAAVRAIWDYHANTRDWGDIGYNYLIDGNGTVYEGRAGGDGVRGGHTLGYNRGSLGVAVLGCFQSTSSTCRQLNGGAVSPPSDKVIDSLIRFLSWKTTNFEINAYAKHDFCDTGGDNCLRLWTIAAHRDAAGTSCNGDLFYEKMGLIRQRTDARNDSGWPYSAKQLDYAAADLRGSRTDEVTLRFKNTGTLTWSNSTRPLWLTTSNPDGRWSSFRGDDWISDNVAAVLNEAAVPPGGTGSFTFSLKRPPGAYGWYFEHFRLVGAGDSRLASFYALPVNVLCSIGQLTNPRANGILIRSPVNGGIYLLEEGERRHVPSALAAATNHLDLDRAIGVTAGEIDSIPAGPAIKPGEGALLKKPDSAGIYVLDDTGTGYVRRWVSSRAAMETFGLKYDQVHTVSSATLDSYAAGAPLTPASPAPDGRLIKGPTAAVYLVESGQRRWISSLSVLRSYGYSSREIGLVDQSKVDQLPSGSPFNRFRPGTLVKADNSPKLYATDFVDGTWYKRWISSPEVLTASGFWRESLYEVPSAGLSGYADSTAITCHQ